MNHDLIIIDSDDNLKTKTASFWERLAELSAGLTVFAGGPVIKKPSRKKRISK